MVDYSRASRVLLLADDLSTRRSVELAAEASAARVVHGSLAEASERLQETQGFQAVFVGFASDDLPRAETLLDRIARISDRETRFVIATPPSLVDLATAHAWGGSILHVCEPTAAEQSEALGWALAREPDRLHDSSRGTTRLQQLSQEAGRIASALASLSEAEAERDSGHERPVDAGRIRGIIRARRLRDQFLGADLFADPAWDMLLDLMAARLEGQRVPVSSLCMAAAVPPTTALRWIKVLTEQGLLVRAADPEDGRRIYIELADKVAEALDAYLRAAQRISPIVF